MDTGEGDEQEILNNQKHGQYLKVMGERVPELNIVLNGQRSFNVRLSRVVSGFESRLMQLTNSVCIEYHIRLYQI